jgi:hypothetical protein
MGVFFLYKSRKIGYNIAMSNEEKNSLNNFIEDYNQLFNVPNTKANTEVCQKYKSEHPNEFKNYDWSIQKHRKRFMDWMSRQQMQK